MNDQYEYDYMEEADILEIFFERGAATCAVEITDYITLRFRPEEKKAMHLPRVAPDGNRAHYLSAGESVSQGIFIHPSSCQKF